MSSHPITPPPELMQQWATEWHKGSCTQELLEYVATQAARWGADQELEACEKWLSARTGFMDAHDLHAARRPKPPSLKQQALGLVSDFGARFYRYSAEQTEIIRRALEQLDE